MRDIAEVIMSALRDGIGPAAENPATENRVTGNRADASPAGDWCQTGPGGEAVSKLAAQLRCGGR